MDGRVEKKRGVNHHVEAIRMRGAAARKGLERTCKKGTTTPGEIRT